MFIQSQSRFIINKKNGKFTDVKLLVNESEMFSLHKFILISRSKKFEMLLKAIDLQKNFKNLNQDSEPNHIEAIKLNIKQKQISVSNKDLIFLFNELISWIYTGEISFPDSHILVFELFLMADEYFLEDLKRKCEENLEFNLNDDSITDLLLLSFKYKNIVSQSFLEICIQSFVDRFHKLEISDNGN